MKNKKKLVGFVEATDVDLIWFCPECKSPGWSPLSEIVQNGTAVCRDCDIDMVICGICDKKTTKEIMTK